MGDRKFYGPKLEAVQIGHDFKQKIADADPSEISFIKWRVNGVLG
jgi:hypothetical protein